jgi:hypothetical protein
MRRLVLPLVLLLAAASDTRWSQPAGSPGVFLREEGAVIGQVNQINCVGTGITCARNGLIGTITIDGGSSGGSSGAAFDGGFTTIVGNTVTLDGGLVLTYTPPPDAGITNTLTAGNLSKAWARIWTGSATPQIRAGSNVVGAICASNTVTLSLAAPMDAPRYMAPIADSDLSDRDCRAVSVHASAVNITCVNSAGTDIDLCSAAQGIHFHLDATQGAYTPASPMGWWTFDDNDGGTRIDDSSTNANHLTVSGNPVAGTTGKVGKAWTLDGTGDYFRNSSAVGLEPWVVGDVTFVGWIYIGAGWAGSPSSTHHQIITLYRGAPDDHYLAITLKKADKKVDLSWELAPGGTDFSYQPTMSAIPDTTWTHLAVRRQWTPSIGKFTTTIFVNGSSVASDATGGPVVNSESQTMQVVIGMHASLSFNGWPGAFDQFKLYARALSDSEIAAIYTAEN